MLLKRVCAWGAPLLFIKLLRLVLAALISCKCDMVPLDFVEFFAGQQAVTLAMREAALAAAVFELKLDPLGQNMLTTLGFANAVTLCLTLKPGSGSLLAPVCSSWTFMNRGTSKRSIAVPYGASGVESVKQGNVMVARCVLLLILLAGRGCWWVLGQPRRSLLQEHPAFQHLVSVCPVYRHRIQMCHYGGNSRKSTWLYSNAAWIADVDAFRTHDLPATHAVELATKSINKAGKVVVTGNAQLKDSQHYPKGFGKAICSLYMEHRSQLSENAKALMNMDATWLTSVPAGPWRMANLKPVLKFMRGD